MTRTRTHLTAAVALSLALGLSACGDDDSTLDGVTADAPDAPVEMTDEATGGPSTGPADRTEDAAATSGDDAEAATDVAFVALRTAQDSAGGDAYEIDDQDGDGTWEIDVAVDGGSVEVTVSADGTEVVGTEQDDLDSDDAAAVEAAQVTLVEAIEIALAEVGGTGVVGSAQLEEEDGSYLFEVELDGTDRGDDVEVSIDAVSGEVLQLDV